MRIVKVKEHKIHVPTEAEIKIHIVCRSCRILTGDEANN